MALFITMRLKHWLAAKRGRTTWLAKQLGVLHPQISKYAHGTKVPAERAVEIERATEGAVSRSDLRPDLWAPQERLGINTEIREAS